MTEVKSNIKKFSNSLVQNDQLRWAFFKTWPWTCLETFVGFSS